MKILKLDDAIAKTKPKIMVYGDAGVGKTMLAATLPGEVLIISAEDGERSLAQLRDEDRARIGVVKVSTTAEIREVYDAVAEGELSPDWLVLDSVSEIAEIVLREYKRKDKDPRQSYGKVDDDVTDILRSFRDLACGVLFLAKEHCIKRKISDEVEVDYFGLLLPGQRLTTNVPHLVDEVWRLIIRGDARWIITKNNGRSRAKSRGGLDPEIDVSDGIADVIAKLS